MRANGIRLIVGLGNPGARYGDTRHNAGFRFVDRVARRYVGNFRLETRFRGLTCRIVDERQECWLLKPSAYMNRSGASVASLTHYFRIPVDQLLIAHDELDLPVGTARLKRGGGHAGHNGLRDIVAHLGGGEFWRLRLGIGRPTDGRTVVDYVLGRPSREEADLIAAAIEASLDVLPDILAGEFPRVMNRLHAS